MLQRAAGWLTGAIVGGAFYLLLIDITQLPELLVLVVAAGLAATGYELAREQHIGLETIRPGWLIRIWRPVSKVPGDIALVCFAAFRELFDRRQTHGQFRAVSFKASETRPRDAGRRGLAEALGSFAPNTFIVGIDEERELILAHQLVRTGGREAIDLMDLGSQ